VYMMMALAADKPLPNRQLGPSARPSWPPTIGANERTLGA
jgi:hypothetical protein